MQRLSFIAALLLMVSFSYGQSPHEKGLRFDCKLCHSTGGWKITPGQLAFNHDSTNFRLIGQHQFASCRSCHLELKFAGTQKECIDCHTDMHSNTVGPDCAKCHNSKTWLIENVSQMHLESRFPLTGAHKTADCASCHPSVSILKFEVLGTECIGCHQNDFQTAKEPDHQLLGYSTSCTDCHSSNAAGWKGADFEHGFFPLVEGHAISCKDCHTDGTYNTLPADCFSCHEKDYVATRNPVHVVLDLSTDCTECHTTQPGWKDAIIKDHDSRFFPVYSQTHNGVWAQCSECHTTPDDYSFFSCTDCHEHNNRASTDQEHSDVSGYSFNSVACYGCHPSGSDHQEFNHTLTSFPLQGKHQTTECADCHTNGFAGTSVLCKDCHNDDYSAAKEPVHAAAGIPAECEQCHSEEGWKPSTFNHTATGFELVGAHTGILQCSACHIGQITTAASDCFSCHEVQYNQAKDHLAKSYAHLCDMCHNNNTWNDAMFDHSKTNFPLTGVHTTTDCVGCHFNGYIGTSPLCNSCHAKNYTAAKSPNHVDAGMPVQCENCHTTGGWVPSSFSHTSTSFKLEGAHTSIVQCSSCHKGSLITATSDCYSCHQVQYSGAPGHVSQNYPHDCVACHNKNNWRDANFDHSRTNFPLTGAHTATPCADCHKNGYAGTSTLCITCHNKNYAESANPGHSTAGLPIECENCHTTSVWVPSSFNHTTTGFPLIGAHTTLVQCSACHKGSVTAATADCYSCHQAQFTSAPGHVAQSYPHECTQCHNNNNWLNASFDHAKTSFPLTGAHVRATCASCHTNGYTGTSTLCNSCHATHYAQAKDPNHVSAGIPTLCGDCHTTSAFTPGTFNHTSTGFQLVGAHTSIAQCSSCHKGTVTTATSDCYSCHQTQYNGAPGHVSQSYPHQCTQCHNTNNWLNATFDHSRTSFPLTGAHTRATCASCHKNGYEGTSTLCNSCHTADYTQTKDPNHVTAGIPTLCGNCHTTNAWSPGTFNHTTTGFQLTGAHTSIAQCSSCHKGNLTSASSDCYSCHQTDYNNATNPNHNAAKFPTDCKSCHNSAAWAPSTFNHDGQYFPIYSGTHRGEWDVCSDCHKVATNFQNFTCTDCHEHNKTSMDNEHRGVANYRYLSSACFECHPKGRKGVY